MADTGIKVSREDVDVFEATGDDLLLDMDSPLAKLDSSKDTSFRNILITFANDPPNPDGISDFNQETEIYKFKHGYDYIPSTWILYQNLTPASSGVSIEYAMYGGVIYSPDAGAAAYFFFTVDETYIRLIVRKTYISGFGSGVASIVGFRLRIRVYVFAEDIGVT